MNFLQMMAATTAAMVILGLSYVPANAATITETFDVTATGFSTSPYGAASPVPIDPMTLEFTLTYDPTLSYSGTTTGIILDSVNVSYSLPLAFASISGNGLAVGTFNIDPVGNISLGSGFDIALSATNTLEYARYYAPGGLYADFGGSGTVTVSAAATPAVPEPVTIALFGAGLAGLTALRLRKTTA